MRWLAAIFAVLLAVPAAGQVSVEPMETPSPGRFVKVQIDGVEGEVEVISAGVTSLASAVDGRASVLVAVPSRPGNTWEMTVNGEAIELPLTELDRVRPTMVEAEAYVTVASWNPPQPPRRRWMLAALLLSLIPAVAIVRTWRSAAVFLAWCGVVSCIALFTGGAIATRAADVGQNRWSFHHPVGRAGGEMTVAWPAFPVAYSDEMLASLQIVFDQRNEPTIAFQLPPNQTVAVFEPGAGDGKTPPWAMRLRTIR